MFWFLTKQSLIKGVFGRNEKKKKDGMLDQVGEGNEKEAIQLFLY